MKSDGNQNGASGTWSHLLLDVLRDAQRMAGLTLAAWDALLVYARSSNLLSRLAVQAEALGLTSQLPGPVLPHLEAARVLGARHQRVVAWELRELERALEAVDAPVVLLKGAAYLAAVLPTAEGRYFSDIDILVPHEKLSEIERALAARGWIEGELDPLDRRYFRSWLHELPPLVHRRRHTTLDVHHTILPRTDRLQLDPRLLFESAVDVEGSRLKVLGPAEMVLHAAAHLFRNGRFVYGLRDLADIDAMLRRFSAVEGFWQQLLDTAERLDLRLPCFCGLRYSRLCLQTPLPEAVVHRVAPWRPRWPTLGMIDRLVHRAVLPRHINQTDRSRELAISLLAHWPVPRLKAMATGLFWTKRLPKLRPAQKAATPAGA